MRSKIATLFYENARKSAGRIAIQCGPQKKTFGELAELINRLSHFLIDKGIKKGDHLAIMSNNPLELITFLISAADLGICLIPLNPTLPLTPIEYVIHSCNVQHLVAVNKFFSELNEESNIVLSGIKLSLDGELKDVFADDGCCDEFDRPAVEIDESAPFILSMTSGSTGNPKPIILSQKTKYYRIMAHKEEYSVFQDDIILVSTPLYHSLAERMAIMSLIAGSQLIVLQDFNVSNWVDVVLKQRPTFTITVPSQLAKIIESQRNNNDPMLWESFRTVISSSAFLENDVKNECISILKKRFREIYGTSETSTITDICFSKMIDKAGSVGTPIFGSEIKILRDDAESDFDTECIFGEIGEIACKSKLICDGYYLLEKMMSSQMTDGFFRTGDLGYKDKDGYLYYVGRKSEMIVSEAVNVYPHDIDVVIDKIPEIAECAAFAYPKAKYGEIIAVALVFKEDATPNVDYVKAYCSKYLADFQQPRLFFVVDRLPRNTMGKIQRKGILNYIKRLGLDQ